MGLPLQGVLTMESLPCDRRFLQQNGTMPDGMVPFFKRRRAGFHRLGVPFYLL